MAPPVFTKTLLRVSLPAGGTASATVPDTLVWIVTDISLAVTCPDTAQDTSVTGSAGLELFLIQFLPTSYSGTLHWRGRLELDAGEELALSIGDNSSVSFMFGRVTGYELTPT